MSTYFRCTNTNLVAKWPLFVATPLLSHILSYFLIVARLVIFTFVINSCGELPIKNLQIHLLSVLKAIETAHNSKDIVMLEDLLEFELKDNLTKWKILVTPALKIQAQNLF